jgi:long-chain acyl-CoA synthetase
VAGLLECARASPGKPAALFADGGVIETYGELERESRRLAHVLRGLGLAVGECVGMLVGNNARVFDVYWATQRIGLYLTALNNHSTPEDIAYVLDNCGARMLIASPEHSELARESASRARGVALHASIGGDIDGFAPIESTFGTISENLPLEAQEAGSVIIYSSGTTGRPKGVRRPLSGRGFDDPAYIAATTLVMRQFGFREDDVYLCPAPLYHAAPLRSCTAMQMLGATVVVMHRFSAERILRSIEEHRVTVAQFVPTHFKRLLQLDEAIRVRHAHDTLRTVVHSAAPCPPDLKRAMIEWWGPILIEYYAGTEGGGVMIDSHEWQRRPGSVGRPWEGLSVGILNKNGEVATTPRIEGPIYFRNHPGALPKFAYHDDPEKTAAAYRGDWFTLGDIGYLDEDGYLYLTDRQSNLIISGGVNIYPQECEDLLAAHPQVADVAVIGVPDADMGEAVKAVIVPAEGIAPTSQLAEELIAFVRGRMAAYKCPRSIDFVETLPRSAAGKLKKRLLREEYWRVRPSRLA